MEDGLRGLHFLGHQLKPPMLFRGGWGLKLSSRDYRQWCVVREAMDWQDTKPHHSCIQAWAQELPPPRAAATAVSRLSAWQSTAPASGQEVLQTPAHFRAATRSTA